MEGKIRVVIVDDSREIIENMRTLLRSNLRLKSQELLMTVKKPSSSVRS